MKRLTKNMRSLIASMALVAAMMVFGSTFASAIGWNPPCGNVTIVNNTGCTIGLCPWWNPPLFPPCAPFIAPGGTIVVPTPGAGLQLNGMVSWAGNLYPLNPAPPNPWGPWWVNNYITGPAPGCCVDVFVNVATCTITVMPTPPGGPPCRP